jgi:hypothetical protein
VLKPEIVAFHAQTLAARFHLDIPGPGCSEWAHPPEHENRNDKRKE